MRWLARTGGILSRPADDRWHRTSVPLLGGLALWLAVVGACGASVALGMPVPLTLLAAAMAMFLLGFVDDVQRHPSRYRPAGQSALVLGAGDGGALVVRQLRNNPRYDCRAIAFVDDDQAKQQRKIKGVPVLGTFDDLERLIAQKQPDLLILSTDKLPPARLTAVRDVSFASGTTLLRLRFSLDPLVAPRKRGLP